MFQARWSRIREITIKAPKNVNLFHLLYPFMWAILSLEWDWQIRPYLCAKVASQHILTSRHWSGFSYLQPILRFQPSGPPELPKPSKLKRSQPVTIRPHDVIIEPQDGGPPSIGHRQTKRPSLPNIHFADSTYANDECPPPCIGPVYQNQRSTEAPPVSTRKMSLPAPGVMHELQNNLIFQKRKQSVPM